MTSSRAIYRNKKNDHPDNVNQEQERENDHEHIRRARRMGQLTLKPMDIVLSHLVITHFAPFLIHPLSPVIDPPPIAACEATAAPAFH